MFFVAFTVLSLFRRHGAQLLALAWGATAGCSLASIHALVPAFDPFAVSRPDDIPFVSAIGFFARATGAFTSPNNLGSYAAYAVMFVPQRRCSAGRRCPSGWPSHAAAFGI